MAHAVLSPAFPCGTFCSDPCKTWHVRVVAVDHAVKCSVKCCLLGLRSIDVVCLLCVLMWILLAYDGLSVQSLNDIQACGTSSWGPRQTARYEVSGLSSSQIIIL